MDSDVWKEVRIEAIRRDMEMGQLVEEALRKELMRSLDERRNKISDFEVKEQEQSREKIQPMQQPYQQDKNIENVNVNPGVVSSRVAGPGKQSQQFHTQRQEPAEEEIEKEADEISEELEYDYQLTIPGLSLPIDRKRLLQIMREVQNEFNKKYNKVPLEVENALFLIEKLEPNKMYKSSSVLKDDLDILVSDKKIVEKLIGIPERLPGCSVVHTDPISEWDDERWERRMREDYEDRRLYQERKQQYEKKMKLAT